MGRLPVSSKESGTTSCFPEKEEWTGSGISQAFCQKSSYLVIKVACMDMMFLTPAFIRKTTGPAFLDQIQPFFICTSWIFLGIKIQLLVFYLE